MLYTDKNDAVLKLQVATTSTRPLLLLTTVICLLAERMYCRNTRNLKCI
jgi:hypothetical protein